MRDFKKYKKSWWLIGILGLTFIFSLFFLQKQMYPATKEAQIISGQAFQKKDYTLYSSGINHSPSLIFYPGALVESASYSLWAKQLAAFGYDVYILRFPFNLAILKGNLAEKIIQEHPQQSFVLAGHSLGGVMASRFATKNPEQIAGLVFLASYPDQKGDLSQLNLPVLSITATKDGVLNQGNYQQAKQYLSKRTSFATIEGGNHAGFGSYGPQKGDNKATIDALTQQTQLAQIISAWLQSTFNTN